MKKKRIRETLAVVLVISILSACAGPKQEGGSEPAASAEPEGTRTEEPAASAEDAANQEDALSETVSNNEDTVQGNLSGADGETTDNGNEDTFSAEKLEALLAGVEPVNRPYTGERPQFLGVNSHSEMQPVIPAPSVDPYTIEPDLSNVENLWQFYVTDDFAEKLSRNGFVVSGEAGFEFYEIYENDRYEQIANFVTVDSMMHTYHLYFAYLMKNIEKDYL